jgi:branched-chain amino acid transport system permease protein
MENVLLFSFIGLGLGSIYGLIGLILVVTFNATRVINLAVGEFVMIGAIVSAILVNSFQIPMFWGILVGLSGAIIVGIALNWLIVSPLLNKHMAIIIIIIGTYAGALLISGGIGALTDFSYVGTPAILSLKVVKFGIISIVPQYALCIVVTAGVLIAYWYFLNRTHFGWALKATSINRNMCELLGISTSKMVALAFAISGAIGAVAGLLVGPMSSVNAQMGFPMMINGFIASVLGGMGNPYAAVVGGVVIGFLHVFIAGYFAPGYAQVTTFLLLIGILYVRPYGMFGVREE